MQSYRIGISWTSQIIRLAVFLYDSGRYSLVRLDRIPIATKNFSEVAQAFELWSRHHIPSGAFVRASVTVPEGVMYIKEIDIPEGSDIEVQEAIRWELLTKNTTIPQDVTLSWKRISRSGSHTACVYALRESQSLDIVSSLSNIGWHVSSIEPFGVSYGRCVPGKTAASFHIQIDGNQASVGITDGQTAYFATLVDLPQSQANADTGKLTVQAIEHLVSKTRQASQFWKTRTGTDISRVTLSGDGIHNTRLKHLLKTSIGLEITDEKPTIPKHISRGKHSSESIHEYGVPIGAAIRLTSYAYEDDINVLHRDAMREEQVRTRISQFTGALQRIIQVNFFISIMLISLILSGLLLTQHYQRMLDQNKKFITNHPAQKIVPEVQKTNALLETIQFLMANQKDFGIMLSTLSSHTPIQISYSSLKYTSSPKPSWILEGIGSRTSILAFYYMLENALPQYTVVMPYSSLAKEKDSVFVFNIYEK